MRLLVWNIVLAILWASTTENFTGPNLLLGFFAGFVVLLLLRRLFPEREYFRMAVALPEFLLFLVVELFRANMKVAYHTLSPLRNMTPGVIAVPLEPMNEMEITAIANLITFTPGTLSMDVSPDRKWLYVHVIDLKDPDQAVLEIKRQFEARMLRMMRWAP
jgi:multicomponent Na+:H+ antiporter subunit E